MEKDSEQRASERVGAVILVMKIAILRCARGSKGK